MEIEDFDHTRYKHREKQEEPHQVHQTSHGKAIKGMELPLGRILMEGIV